MSNRGTVLGLPVTRPIVGQLPAIYQDAMFVRDFTSGLDDVLAPAVAVLDCLQAYVDPWLAPGDFVAWLGGWVGTALDEDWPLERQRRFLAEAVRLFAIRGTSAGLAAELAIYTGGSVVVDDPGSVWVSSLPTDESGRKSRHVDDRTVRVTVDVPDAASVNWPALQVMVRDAVPAHLPVEIELRETGAGARSDAEQGSESA